VSATGRDAPGLVVAFLGELLLLQAADGFIGRTIRVRALGSPPTSLVASVAGEPFDPARHPSGIEVKAITLHALAFDPVRGRARVIVDI
jgi:SHS2 domain-containing protein